MCSLDMTVTDSIAHSWFMTFGEDCSTHVISAGMSVKMVDPAKSLVSFAYSINTMSALVTLNCLVRGDDRLSGGYSQELFLRSA